MLHHTAKPATGRRRMHRQPRLLVVKTRLRVLDLEGRIAPATLLHTLYPDPTGPGDSAYFGGAVASTSAYRVVSASGGCAPGIRGQVFIYDSVGNNLIATLNNPSPALGG